MFVCFFSTRLNLPSYAESSTLQTNTDFCQSPANLNCVIATIPKGSGEDCSDGDGLRLETEDRGLKAQVWLVVEERRPSTLNEGLVFEGAQPRSVFRCALYRSQIRLKRLGQSPCSAYLCCAIDQGVMNHWVLEL